MTRFNFAFRPASYWDHTGPVSAILSNIKGQTRRRWVRQIVTSRASANLGEIPAEYFEPSLDPGTRSQLGAMHRSWMGGEYLPDYLPGEVEIARVVLDSTTKDVISFRARRRGRGRRILYRAVDEYPEAGGWICRPASSAQPLTLWQMIRLIDTARSQDMDQYDGSLVDLLREGQQDCDPPELVGFVTVESDIYPALSAYYHQQARLWAARRQNSRK